MQKEIASPRQYIDSLPEDRKKAVTELRNIFRKNLPKGFSEAMSYGMISYVVPHSVYPAGYHVDPKQPLPFISIASQKSHIAVYHMGVVADEELLAWFTDAYSKVSKTKLDIGKSCIRFKKPEQIPYALLGELASRMTPAQWIAAYEKGISSKKR